MQVLMAVIDSGLNQSEKSIVCSNSVDQNIHVNMKNHTLLNQIKQT